jgi:hypothetical protein
MKTSVNRQNGLPFKRHKPTPFGLRYRSPALATVRHFMAVVLCGLTTLAWAQTAEPAAPVIPPAPVPAPVPAPSVAEPAAVVAPTAAPVIPVDPCRPLTDQAMSADFKAASAQSQRKGADELSALFDEAINLWQRAGDACTGRAKERALRNLQDSRKSRGALSELLDSGAQCASSHKDADALHELAKQASTERRWLDASLLYRKAENMWELASESCTGNQQQQALKRREEAETDGHNTEFCAPVFDRARTLSQKLRAANSASNDEKTRASLLAETAWRDASGQCRGNALEVSRNNIQTIARERGTAWVATREAGVTAPLPSLAPAPVAVASAFTTPSAAPRLASASPAAAVASLALATSVGAGVAGTGSATGGGSSAAVSAATALTPAKAAGTPSLTTAGKIGTALPPEFVAGTARFSGTFVTAAANNGDGTSYSGRGKVVWDNGDSFDGSLVKGQRQGEGQFVWASGQRYSGTWEQDQPRGQGQMQFTNGNRYQGRVEDGLPEGQGVMRYASGDEFTGQLKRGSPNGRGVYAWASGQRFEGEWLQGVAQGAGTLKFANGDVFEGPVRDGVPHGPGRLVYASGDIYTGNFKNGRPDGEGRFAWKMGDVYTGQWRDGLKEGAGVMTWANGDRWEGRFSRDEQAEGVLIRRGG